MKSSSIVDLLDQSFLSPFQGWTPTEDQYMSYLESSPAKNVTEKPTGHGSTRTEKHYDLQAASDVLWSTQSSQYLDIYSFFEVLEHRGIYSASSRDFDDDVYSRKPYFMASPNVMRMYYVCPQHVRHNALEKLGEGSYGSVFKGWYLQSKVAIKFQRLIEPLSKANHKDVMNEMITLSRIGGHPNIVHMVGFLVSKQLDVIVTVLDYMAIGSLRRYYATIASTRHDEHSSIKYMLVLIHILHQIANGLAYLHEQLCIAHLDVKLDNVLLHTTSKVISSHAPHTATEYGSLQVPLIKISDFGLSQQIHLDYDANQKAKLTNYFQQIPYYMDIAMTRPDPIYIYKTDIYSFGYVIKETYEGGLESALSVYTIPTEMVSLFKGCVDPDPTKRPDIATVQQIIQSIEIAYCRQHNLILSE